MAQILSATVLANPDGTDFSGQTNPCPVLGIPVTLINDAAGGIAPLSATQATAFPSGTAQIAVRYFSANAVLTGSYIVGVDSVATLITRANA